MDIVTIGNKLPAMTAEGLEKVAKLEAIIGQMPQAEIETDHVIHGGMYARTIEIPAGVMLTGALIKVPTTLIINGRVTVFIGEQMIDVEGYRVIPASAGRKQAFYTWTTTQLTMIFATDCKSIADCEMQFTDEYDNLMSRQEDAKNTITITGE